MAGRDSSLTGVVLRIDFREAWHSEEGGSGFTVDIVEGQSLACIGSEALVHGENSTRLRAPLLEEPGNDAGDSGVLVSIIDDFVNSSFLREEVEGGLGGRPSRIDIVTWTEDEMAGSAPLTRDKGRPGD